MAIEQDMLARNPVRGNGMRYAEAEPEECEGVPTSEQIIALADAIS